MKCSSLIYYSNLALPQEDNDFVANFLREGCKIIEKDINENSEEKYQIEIDFLHVEKGEKGVNEIIKKLNSYNKFFFSHAHTISKYNKEILNKINQKDFLYFFNSNNLTYTDTSNLLFTGKADRSARVEFIQDEIELLNNEKIYFFHTEARLFEKVISNNKNNKNFRDFSFKGMETEEIVNKIQKIFEELNDNDLIILDVGLKCLKEVFSFLEVNEFNNKVINNYGSLENRFKKISFNLIQLTSLNICPSLSLEDLINKIYKEDIGANKKSLILDSAYRLEYPLLIAQAIDKCDENDIKNLDYEKLRSSILSFNGTNDIFFGNRLQYGFNTNGENILKDNYAYIFPNSLQIKDNQTPKIMYKKQYISEQNIIKKKSVVYAYIDILRVTNIDIKARFWTAELYLDIVSNFSNPIEEILFNNLSTLNDKFSYKEIWVRTEEEEYSTKRYYVVANFDFLPVAENYPFDWQNIYISMTIKNNEKNILQPIPLDLVDRDFDISEWKIQNSLTGIKYQKNRLYQDTDLKKTVSINKENRIGWILKRKNTATLFKVGIPMSFLIFLVYYSIILEYEKSSNSIGILTTTFLSAIALYFSVEKPEPKRMTIIDLVFVWFYIVNGVTVVTCGMASFISEQFFNFATATLKIVIPLSLVSIGVYLWRRVRRNRESILLDRDV